jgi:hypothetical protein
MLLTKIFQTTDGQRTGTFLSSADVGQDNFAAAMLDQMTRRRSGAEKGDRHRLTGAART